MKDYLFEYPLLKMLAIRHFVVSSNSFISFYMALEAQSLILYILAALLVRMSFQLKLV